MAIADCSPIMVTPGPPRGWDFTPGDSIRDEVLTRFSSHVHFSRFFLLAAFPVGG